MIHRLFAALELPLPIRDALLAAQGGVANARWQTDDQLHLTLRFIGEVDRHRAHDITAALAGVNGQPFTLALAAPGTFDRRGRIDTLWVGVTPQQEVAALARRIDSAIARVGIPAETRAFLPHITLARFTQPPGPLHGFPASPLPITPWPVTGFALFESHLSRDGASYRILERYPIR
jgi:2'-5' RNA ligase